MKKTLAKNIGKIMALISCLIIALALVSCSDKDEDNISENGEGLYFTLNEDGESYSVSGVYADFDTPNYLKIIIPEEYDGKPVTEIKSLGTENLFYGFCYDDNSSLECLEIPHTIEYINWEAISSCDALKSIEVDENNLYFKTIDDVLYTKDETTICHYPAKKTVTAYEISDSVTSIGDYAFYDCDSLTSVTIPDSVTSIGDCAFRYCSSLTSVTIPENVTSIGGYAFAGCYKLVEVINKSSLNIVAGSEDYGYVACNAIEVHTGESKIVNKDGYLFYTCNGVNYLFGYVGNDTELTLLESYNGEKYVINDYAFSDCYSLTSVTIPESVTSIGDYAFYFCRSLTSVTIGNSVTSIGDYAFRYCTSLESITIPDSVTSIGNEAFQDCTSLTSVTIPDSVTDIGWHVFDYSSKLTICCECDAKPEGWNDSWVSDNEYAKIIWGYIPE